MTNNKKYLINEFNRLYRIEYYSRLVKIIFLIIFLGLSPFLIYDEIISGKYLIVAFLIIAELFILFFSYTMYLSIRQKTSFAKSRINKCFHNQDILNKIIITNNKILFDISDMEDESIYLKNTEYRRKIINALKSVFGESKIISNL